MNLMVCSAISAMPAKAHDSVRGNAVSLASSYSA